MPKPVRNLGKTDVDFVMDVHVKEQKELLMELTRKMYVRNPDQLRKLQDTTIEDRMLQIFGRNDDIDLPSLVFEELGEKTGIEAILLAFDESFQGDRVFAAMVGLTEMLRRSYNHQQEFFILDSLDEQALYNSARNIEIFVWRLYHRQNSHGELFLLSNHVADGEFDTSFDRIFAKMTMIQDMMALIVADKTNRSITKVAQGVAQFVFLPIP
ncbi:putative lipoprotein [Vibrio ichthyoenteri ATCC 700023]|uniref:Putative lipoprotein n=2 Tax=Vibrio ichthyoenteri TaxID=142461 RepID=F9S1X7_9VIBR|nr:putative lipoprotein [Vibrio ichthyoenteri ATCC 700023]